jgi:hypothetical protein
MESANKFCGEYFTKSNSRTLCLSCSLAFDARLEEYITNIRKINCNIYIIEFDFRGNFKRTTMNSRRIKPIEKKENI